MTYSAPLNTIRYLMRHCVDFSDLQALPAFGDMDDDLVSDILEGANSFAGEVLAPLNKIGDENGAKLENGKVVAAPGFKQAYSAWVEAGWQGLTASAEIGGMGLPQTIGVAVAEMVYGANMAFGLCPMLTASALNAIHAHASDELKDTYLPKMVTGEWSGAMNLTEPQAGSDLGALKCKAVPNGDGSYSVSGQKIFINWGDHEMAENIIHLVLARLPDAPEGSRGISLFLVPKYLSNGEKNPLGAIGLEHKMGIHGSPTCVMEFDGAKGFLVGEENRGLACMFTMMNEARLYVGAQGVAIGERAYGQALAYAGERVQGRVLDAAPGTPIIGHADVRRMLMEVKTGLLGARAIVLATALATDLAHNTDDKDLRKKSAARAALLTPIAKSYGSDMGVYATSQSVQIHGGMGYIEETGAAQHYRDARIAPIYEGTNGIQALDLVGRKLRRDGGQAMRDVLVEIGEILRNVKDMNGQDGPEGHRLDFGCNVRHLEAGLAAMRAATDMILAMEEQDAQAAAFPYQELCGHVISGALLIKSVLNGYAASDSHAAVLHKLVWFHSLVWLAKAPAYLEQIKYGAAPVFATSQQNLADV